MAAMTTNPMQRRAPAQGTTHRAELTRTILGLLPPGFHAQFLAGLTAAERSDALAATTVEPCNHDPVDLYLDDWYWRTLNFGRLAA
jgi:hypothetical protein